MIGGKGCCYKACVAGEGSQELYKFTYFWVSSLREKLGSV